MESVTDNYEDPIVIQHQQEHTLDALSQGDIEEIRISQKLPVDSIVEYGLELGILKKGLQSFPDPRMYCEVPIDALLLPQILQRLNDEHSLLLAPYMLNNADLISRLGYNAQVLESGFNNRNKYPREAPFDGETLKHILLHLKPEQLIDWFNHQWLELWRTHSPGRTHQYIVDGCKIEIPAHRFKDYQGAGVVENKDGTYSYGYKAVWMQEIIDRKCIFVTMTLVPIQVHDLEAAKKLLEKFPFEPGASIIADRGFIDGQWITQMKRERGVDFFIPLKRNMNATQSAIAMADNRKLWEPHPSREGQQIAEFKAEDGGLFWKECPVLSSGVLVRWMKKDGTPDEVLFVTTKERQTGKQILFTYDQRSEIEQDHRQLKQNQGLGRLLSTKLVRTVLNIVMCLIGYNLLNLFLNSEKCSDLEQYSLKTMRQKRREEKNPKVIIYTKHTFAVLPLHQFLPLVLGLGVKARGKLSEIFKSLDLRPAPR